MGVVRAAITQTTWTGDKQSMIAKHEQFARDAAAARRVEPAPAARLCKRELHAALEAEKIVARMLACEVVIAAVQKHALVAAGVVHDSGAELASVAGPHNECADGVGAVVDAERERGYGSRFHGCAAAGRGFLISR